MPAVSASKYLVTAGVDDVPHLDAATKKQLWDETPPHLRAARFKGEPSLGVGAIYPIDPDEFRIDPFDIAPHWPRGYTLDDGWNVTAALWQALDRDNDILYFYSEYYRREAEPQLNAAAIRARGDWIPGSGDAAARTRDGEQVINIYRAQGLLLELADKEVEAGIYDALMRLGTGRAKVFSTCVHFFDEYRHYRRDDKGRIVKEDDHVVDCFRYACRPSHLARMITKPVKRMPGLGTGHRGDPKAGY